MSDLQDKIVALRAEGLSFRAIEQKLGCSRSTISYHLSDGQKGKAAARVAKRRKDNGLVRKVETFQVETSVRTTRSGTTSLAKQNQNKAAQFQGGSPFDSHTFRYSDVLDKFGESPNCYLTGDPIDYSHPSTYHFDHIVPRSKGGDNSIANLGLTTKAANQMKGDMSVEEFLDMCEKILRHNGRM